MKGGITMRILVANRFLATTGGSENFTFAIIEEILRLGYAVEYFTFLKGDNENSVSQRIEKLGVPFMKHESYNLILASGNNAVRYLSQYGFVIDTMHGVLPGVEEPSAFADLYVSVSPYICEFYRKQGYESKVIMNGINCRRFKPKRELPNKLRKVLSLCQSKESNVFISKCCAKIGVKFAKVDKNVENKWNIEDDINEVDLVVGIGRSLYDGMACGRAVISYDKRSYRDPGHEGDGYLTKDNIHQSMYRNCTGTHAFTEKEFINELEKYNPSDGNDMRNIALSELNIEKTVPEYINYWNENKDTINSSSKLLNSQRKIVYIREIERQIENTINYYEKSRSWRYTAPFRKAIKFLKGKK
jgi:glycosyltransferase involved in cell wall biosynthesis